MRATARSTVRAMRADPMRRAFERMAAKGGCARPSSQDAADRALITIRHMLTVDERWALGTGRSHVMEDGCNRREWDTACAKIRERLWPSGGNP